MKTLTSAPNEAKNIGKVDLYYCKECSSNNNQHRGVSINAPSPPEDIIAPAIIPRVPISPIKDAISIFLPFFINNNDIRHKFCKNETKVKVILKKLVGVCYVKIKIIIL